MAVPPGLIVRKDKFGNDIWLGDGGEVIFAPVDCIPDYRKHLQHIRDMQLRADDVLIVGYPKSGNNWLHHMVSMLIEGTTHLPPLFGDSNFPFLDICGAGRELAAPDKGRALMSHLAFRYLPRDVEDKRVKIIYLVRNPKDAMVSLYHHVGSTLPPIRYEGSWDQFLTTVLEQGYWYGSIFEHRKEWQRTIEEHPDHPIFLVHYENLKKDTVKQLKELDTFLGTNRSTEFCQAVAATCILSNMENTRVLHNDVISRNTFCWNENRKFYRKGEVGDWKNYFTVAQNEKFDEVCGKKLADCGQLFIFE
ncbi:sulfotransferase 1A2-like [Pomacea canaliculata]|uniref:sulfotransferase 1A2-like n=1 Tax=Pomacea canaliculata TaxID=400727 RepID=UPI000D72BC53|nr:sulfotransferase 1A2-like [Pomacea canaliculata]